MKAFVVLAFLCTAANGADDFCFKDVGQACNPTNRKFVADSTRLNCTAKYGAIEALQINIQKFINHHFIRSFEYLMMSTHFANYEKNRPGFEKLFRSLSDEKWRDSIELIKFVTKRGGSMNFNAISEDFPRDEEIERSFELYEYTAVAQALDFEKKIELEAEHIHLAASSRNRQHHDPEISSHIENEFLHESRDVIRKLAGYTTDLNRLLNGPDSSLSLFLFDEYLQKQENELYNILIEITAP